MENNNIEGQRYKLAANTMSLLILTIPICTNKNDK